MEGESLYLDFFRDQLRAAGIAEEQITADSGDGRYGKYVLDSMEVRFPANGEEGTYWLKALGWKYILKVTIELFPVGGLTWAKFLKACETPP